MVGCAAAAPTLPLLQIKHLKIAQSRAPVMIKCKFYVYIFKKS
jgi:hypothetical protein